MEKLPDVVVVGIFRLVNLHFALDCRPHHIRLIDKQVAGWGAFGAQYASIASIPKLGLCVRRQSARHEGIYAEKHWELGSFASMFRKVGVNILGGKAPGERRGFCSISRI